MTDTNRETRNALEAQLMTLQRWHQREENEPVRDALQRRIDKTAEALQELSLKANENFRASVLNALSELRRDLEEMPAAAGKVERIYFIIEREGARECFR